jgi:hypothetical protein
MKKRINHNHQHSYLWKLFLLFVDNNRGKRQQQRGENQLWSRRWKQRWKMTTTTVEKDCGENNSGKRQGRTTTKWLMRDTTTSNSSVTTSNISTYPLYSCRGGSEEKENSKMANRRWGDAKMVTMIETSNNQTYRPFRLIHDPLLSLLNIASKQECS